MSDEKYLQLRCVIADLTQEAKLLRTQLSAALAKSEQRRKYLLKYEWVENNYHHMACPICLYNKRYGHGPDCAWAAAMKEEA